MSWYYFFKNWISIVLIGPILIFFYLVLGDLTWELGVIFTNFFPIVFYYIPAAVWGLAIVAEIEARGFNFAQQ